MPSKGVPLQLTQAARKQIREAVMTFIRTHGHRDYKFSDIAAMAGYPTSCIAAFVRKYMASNLQPKCKAPRRKALYMDKPEYVLNVEKTTGLQAFPYKHNETGIPEWRLMSPTGVLLLILVGEDNLLHGVRATKSMFALQGITRIDREIRMLKGRRSRPKNEQDITELADKLWENEENE